MTIIYNKRTGKIKNVFSGDLQHIDTIFGNEAEDYKLILDEITIEDDINVLRNFSIFKVNIGTKELELVLENLNYPIAANN